MAAARHLLVDFSGRAGAAVVGTLDDLRAPAAHEYTWQLTPDDGVRGELVGGEDRPAFVLRATGDAFLKGWVLAPEAASVSVDGGVRIRTHGESVKLWVAMVVGRGAPPIARITGAGMSSTVTIDRVRLRYEPTTDRLQAD